MLLLGVARLPVDFMHLVVITHRFQLQTMNGLKELFSCISLCIYISNYKFR